VLVAVNAGGSQFTAADGTSYQADTLFSGGNTYRTTAAIAGTTDDALYQSERYDNFTYNVPVANGDYVVTLKFAEIDFSSAGMRVFDVLIEDATVVSNLDVLAQVGRKTAHDVTVSVRVTDGMLNITFRSIIDNAKVSAITIKDREAI
jgi:Malectin domain